MRRRDIWECLTRGLNDGREHDDYAPRTTTTSRSATPTRTASTTSQTTTTTSRATPTTTAMASGEITVNFSIDSTYAEGLDKAVACDEPVLFCIIVDSTVYDDNGVLSGSSCHTAFRLFHGDSTEVFERGRGNCGDDIYLGRDPMAAGPYRLELDIEMDDGTTGSAVYNFTMLAE